MLSNLSSADAVSGTGRVNAAGAGGFVSRAIMFENFRRFWPIGLVALVIYIVSGPLPMLLRVLAIDPNETTATTDNPSIVTMSISVSIGSAFIGILFAAVTAVAVFRYMHSPSSLAVVHAFPVERAVLFRSNFLSGFMLFAIPYIISDLLTLPIMGYLTNYLADHSLNYGSIPEAYTDVSAWPLLTGAAIVIMLYTYAVTVLAGMVSGNTPVHLITAVIFNFAWMPLFFFGAVLAQRFLIGSTLVDSSSNVLEYFHPFAYYVSENLSSDGASIAPKVMLLVYTALSALIVAIAWLLYRSFKAERAGDSITRRAVEHIFVCVVAITGLFIGGELLGDSGIYSRNIILGSSGYGSMDYVDKNYIVGAYIGAAVAFVIATMILRKSARVFDLRLLRRFAAFAVAAAVFFVCIMTNVTGFETRVPAVADISAGAFHAGWDLTVMPPYKQGTDSIEYSFIPIKGEDDLRALKEFHRSVIEEQAALSDADVVSMPNTDEDGYYLSTGAADITYAIKGGMNESRRYTLSSSFISDSGVFARLISCDSVKNYRAIKNLLGYDALEMPELTYFESYGGEEKVSLDTEVRQKLTEDALKELAACLDEDYLAMGANDMMHPGAELFTLQLSSKRPEAIIYGTGSAAAAGKGESARSILKRYNEEQYAIKYTVTEKSVKTIAWLKDAGVYDSLVKSAEELKDQYEKYYR